MDFVVEIICFVFNKKNYFVNLFIFIFLIKYKFNKIISMLFSFRFRTTTFKLFPTYL